MTVTSPSMSQVHIPPLSHMSTSLAHTRFRYLAIASSHTCRIMEGLTPFPMVEERHFSAKMSGYDLSRSKKEYNIKMSIENEEDRYLYYIDVFDNGRASILVTSQNRTDILFYGDME